MVRIAEKRDQGTFSTGECCQIGHPIIKAFTTSMDLSRLHIHLEDIPESQPVLFDKPLQPPPTTRETGVTSQELVAFFSAALGLTSTDETGSLMTEMMSTLISQVPQIPP